MRISSLFLTAGLVALSVTCGACGDSVPVRARASSADEAALPHLARAGASGDAPAPSLDLPRPLVAAAAPGDAPVVAGAIGALENDASLKRFYEALARLDAGQSHQDVTVLHFGDSHTAADFETGPLRRALQARFGDGGRGFVAVGEPWKHYVQEGLRCGGTHDWEAEKAHPTKASKGRLMGDGLYGLAGVALHADRPGARAWGEYTAKASRIELSYLEQPGGGSFDVYIDGARSCRISTRGARASAWRPFDVPEGAGHRLEIVTAGDGDVRLFGAALGREQVGVTYDALGINGARITNVLAWDEAHMAEQIRHRAPDLVVLAYGTNESGDSDVPLDAYERQLVDLLGRISRAAPSASCMLLGPPDRAVHTHEGWGTLPRLLDVIAVQRRVAQAAGCAFFDQLEAMGGPGTIAQWAEELQPRAAKDRVHLSREGYSELGNAVAADLIRGYTRWHAGGGAPPAQEPLDVAQWMGSAGPLPPLPALAEKR